MTKMLNPTLELGGSLETRRLVLRDWKKSDLEDFYAYASDPEVGPRAGWQVHKTREITRKVLEHFMEIKTVFAIEHKASGRLIGSLGIHGLISPVKEYFAAYNGRELGFVLNSEYWNRGLISEALVKVIDDLFLVHDLDYLVAGHFAGNDASKAVIEKMGFSYIGDVDYIDQAEKVQKTLMYYLWNPGKPDPFEGVEDIFEEKKIG